MSFSELPGELRNQIYHELLCPPDGVHLHVDRRFRDRMSRAKSDSVSHADSKKEEASNNGSGDGKHQNKEKVKKKEESFLGCVHSSSDVSPTIPVPTAIFYVSRQTRKEASEIFYGCNRFTFDSGVCVARDFLKCLPRSFRRCIRHIGLMDPDAVVATNRQYCSVSWGPLEHFVSRHMSVKSVTVQVSRGSSWMMNARKPAAKRRLNSWWLPEVFAPALMAGEIEQIRIGHLPKLKPVRSRKETQHQKATISQLEDLVRKLHALSLFLYPQSREELERDLLEERVLLDALKKNKGKAHIFNSWTDIIDIRAKPERLTIAVAREDDPVGTVLVLTRPTAS